MGASFQMRVVREKPDQKWYDQLVDGAAWAHDHGGYSGSFAEAAGTLTFPPSGTHQTLRDAANWLEEHHQKWDAAMAVPFKNDAQGIHWAVGAWCSE